MIEAIQMSEPIRIRRNLKAPGRASAPVVSDADIDAMLASDRTVVALGVSGGKDSCALVFATVAHLKAIGFRGRIVLIHSDLGRVEWKDSLPTCERLATVTGLDLIVVKREAGDMMDRWRARWASSVERYANLECVKVILPWSTPSMRFCTSELKSAVIARELQHRFPGCTIVSASGIRRDESGKRRLAPTSKPNPRLTSRVRNTSGRDWHPIADWSIADVLACLDAHGFALHEAYTRYGMTRVSCAFCIMSNADDLAASATCPDNAAIYREMVRLEIDSTFAFQAKWLGDVAPTLLDAADLEALDDAKLRAAQREVLEEEIPEHLLYTKGWPTVMPTPEEAELLASVRRRVAAVLGIDVKHTTGESVRARYAELMAAKESRDSR